MQEDFWSTIAQRRLSRRRALGVTGGLGLGATLLAACGSSGGGGSGSSGGSSAQGNGLVTKTSDTTSQAKRGGVLKDYAQAEPRSLDPVNPLADYNRIAPFVYNTMLTVKPGHLQPTTGVLQGQLAQSYETSPDGLTITFKLRPGVKWHNLPPVNGRALSTDDILYSFEKYAKQGPLGTLVFNSAAPSAPVLSATAPDKSTIVLKLKEPVVYVPNWFASFGSFTGQIIIYPKEADSSLDLRKDIVGTGPFQLKDHKPSVGFTLARNPDFWDKNAAMFDEIQMPIVQEYAARLSQLRAGNIYYAISSNTLRAEDVLTLKGDAPKIQLYQSPFDTALAGTVMTFGHLPAGGNKFQDERVRQAISMSWDRDLYISAYYNVDNFEKAGLPVETGWSSGMPYNETYKAGGWFLDPKSKEFGPNAQYYQYNVAEAKKLLAAAGVPTGFEVPMRWPNTPQYNLTKQTQPIIGFFQDIGLSVKQNGLTDYTQDYIPHDRDASGDYEGVGIHSVTGGTPILISPVSALVALHMPSSGVTFNGYDANGKGDKSGDPQLIDMLSKARTSADVNTQKKLIQDAQRYLGKSQYIVLLPGAATGFWAAWPTVKNFRTWDGGTDEVWEHYGMWIDPTQAPLA